MFIHTLKSKILVNLAIILLLAILLTDYVIIIIIQKKIILQKIHSGQIFLANFAQFADNLPDERSKIISDSSFIYGYLITECGEKSIFGEDKNDIILDIPSITRQAIKDKRTIIVYTGETWGVFWRQKKYVSLSMPISAPSTGATGGTVVLQLDDIYKTLRQSQGIIVFYLIINFLILLIFWFHRFSRLIFKPIRKIINIAKEYTSTERIHFAPGKEYSEFNELSNALNRLIQRIEFDNEKLKNSLKKLQEANEELRRTQSEMIRTEKLASIGRLSAGLAHEIGNPVGIILGYLGLLKNRPEIKQDYKTTDYIDRSEKEINRINETIRQLLDFSRTYPNHYCSISIHDLVQEIVQIMSEQPLMSNVNIKSRLSAENDSVYADYDQMRQVVINLMINAADSIAISDNKLKGCIELTTEILSATSEMSLAQKMTLKLTVEDNGTGIATQELESIFDPFYTTKEPGKGTGLGLSVSYSIIEQIGGVIFADSEIGKGTTMVILLPLIDRDESCLPA